MAKAQKTTLRNAAFDDCVEASALLVRLGLVMAEGEEAVKGYFEQLWQINPAIKAAQKKPSLGWVLEDGGKMVGFFGNVPLLYQYGGAPVIASDASLWGVEKDYRVDTERLSNAYFNQENADLLMVTTAIKPTARIFERYGAARLPQPDFDQILYWIIDGQGFVRAGLQKKGYSAVASWVGGGLGGVVLNARMRLFGRRPFALLNDINIITVNEIDDAFDSLWRQKVKEYPNRLLAVRDAATLRWHFSAGRFSDQTRVVCCHRSGHLAGYAVLIRDDVPTIGLKRLKLADLFVAGDDPAIIGALLTAAFEYGLAKRCHVLEAVGLPQHLRGHLLVHKPLIRPMATYPFYFKALNPELTKALENGESWYATAFDGDITLL